MNSGLLGRRARALGLGLGLLFGAGLTARASQQTLTSGAGAGTDFAGQRNVIFILGVGYWAFFHAVNPTASEYSFSPDGSTWSTAQSVFPTSTMAPDVAAGQASIWYVSSGTVMYVYAVANDGNVDIGGSGTYPANAKQPLSADTSGNKVFARRGVLCTSGSCPTGNITWDAAGNGVASQILRQEGTVRVQDDTRPGLCQVNKAATGNLCNAANSYCARFDAQAGHSAVITYTPAGGTGNNLNSDFVSIFADAGGYYNGAEGPYVGMIGYPGIAPNLGGYASVNADGTNNIILQCANGGNTANPTNFDPTMVEIAAPTAVPIYTNQTSPVTNSTGAVLVGYRMYNNNTGANEPQGQSFAVVFSSANGGEATESAIPSGVPGTNLDVEISSPAIVQGDDFYGMSALNEGSASVSSSAAHFVWTDSSGSLRYAMRTSTMTFSPSNPANAMTLMLNTWNNASQTSACNGGTGCSPYMHPSLSLVTRSAGATAGEDVYAVFSDSNGISYVSFPNTLALTGPATVNEVYQWRSCGNYQGDSPYNTNSCTADNPKLGFWGQQPDPLPVIWQDYSTSLGADVVYFDKIITSTCPIPVISSMSISETLINGTSDFIFSPNFTVRVTGNPSGSFNCYPNATSIAGGIPYPQFKVLASSQTQTAISAVSVSYIDGNDINVNLQLSNSITAGFPYDVRMIMRDGQEVPSVYNRFGALASQNLYSGIGTSTNTNIGLFLTIPPPQIFSVSAVNPITGVTFSSVSAGAVYQSRDVSGSSGTITFSSVLTIGGTTFMDWNGVNSIGKNVTPSTATVTIQFQNSQTGAIEPGISVASLTYIGNTGSQLRAYVIVSTSVLANDVSEDTSPYHIILTNPSSGTATTATLYAGGTFYVTVPTATVTSPLPGYWTNAANFQVITGTVGFNNVNQTSISSVQVRITYQGSGTGSGYVWNGTVMTPAASDPESNWLNATLSQNGTAYWYTGASGLTSVNAPNDGLYEIAVRVLTNDGAIGDPYLNFPNLRITPSTVAMTMDRSVPQYTENSPVNGVSTNSITSISANFTDLGTGLTTVQFMIQDIGLGLGNVSTGAWVAFTTAGAAGAPGVPVWLSTASPYTPQSMFGTSPVAPNVTETVAISSPSIGATSIAIPHFQSGHQYRISVNATSPAGKCVDTSSGTTAGTTGCTAGFTSISSGSWVVIYDTTPPSVTVTSPLGLALSSGTATFQNSFTGLGGFYQDNVVDTRESETIYVRVVALQPGAVAETIYACLNPTTLLFDLTCNSGNVASYWNTQAPTLTSSNTWTNWSYSLPSNANITAFEQSFEGSNNGYGPGVYRLEVYAADGASNSSGTAAAPFYQTYFKLYNNNPQILSMTFSTETASDLGGARISTITAYNPTTGNSSFFVYSTAPLNSIELNLYDGSAITVSSFTLSYYNGVGTVFWSSGTTGWESANPVWIPTGATTTWTVGVSTYMIVTTTGVAWVDSELYTLNYYFQDTAGNVTRSTWTFELDSSPPAIGNLSISSGATFSTPADLPAAISGIVTDQNDAFGHRPAGTQYVGLGIQRQSDQKWFTSNLGSPWQAVRADPTFPAASLTNTSQAGGTWSLDTSGGTGQTNYQGSFWNQDSTETYTLYVYAADNVYYPGSNATSSTTIQAVLNFEVQAPTSTLVSPSTTTTNAVWYSTNTGYTLPSIVVTAFDLPTGGQGYAQNILCGAPGGLGSWTGGAANICAEEIELEDYSGTGQCWSGTAFTNTCGIPSALSQSYQQMGGVNSTYIPTDPISTYTYSLAGFWALPSSLVNGHTFRVRARGLDAAVDGVSSNWSPNTEVPPSPSCSAISSGTYNVRCFQVDEQAPTTVVVSPAQGSNATAVSMPSASLSGTAYDAGSGVNQVWVTVCAESGGVPNYASGCLSSLGGTFSVALTTAHYFNAGVTPTATPGLVNWTVSLAGVLSGSWANGAYDVVAFSSDTVNNIEAVAPAAGANSNHVSFTIIPITGAGVIQSPSAQWYQPIGAPYTISPLSTISGTATGNSNAYIVLKDTDNGNYWNGSFWTVGFSSMNAGPIVANNWSTAPFATQGAWQANHNYFVGLMVCDAAGTSCSSAVGACDSATPGGCLPGASQNFVIDGTAPTVAVTTPTAVYLSSNAAPGLTMLQGTASDLFPNTAPNQNGSLFASTTSFKIFRVWDKAEWSVPLSTWVATLTGTKLYATNPSGNLFTYTTTYMASNLMFEDGYQYAVAINGLDNSGNGNNYGLGAGQSQASPGMGASFLWDLTAPSATITSPSPSGIIANNLSTISGTSNDPNPIPTSPFATSASGVQYVQILLKDQDAQAYWNGGRTGTTADWDTSGGKFGDWQTVTSQAPWGINLPPLYDVDSTRLSLWVRAVDNAGNVSVTPSNANLIANLNADGVSPAYTIDSDTTPPVSLVVYPPTAVNYRPTTISGTALDNQSGAEPSGVSYVGIRMTRSDNQSWNFITPGWGANSPAFSGGGLAGLAPWIETNISGAFADGYTYSINPQSEDAANNFENKFTTLTFVVDLSTPTSGVFWPSAGAFTSSSAVTATGFGDDLYRDSPLGSGLWNATRNFESGIQQSSVTIAIADVTTSTNWWTGTSFSGGGPTWSTATFTGASSGTWTWAVPTLTTNHVYTIISRARDAAGNLQTAYSSTTFVYDTTPPVSITTSPAGSITGVPFLYGTANDTNPGAPAYVQISIAETNGPNSGFCSNGAPTGIAWTGCPFWLSSGTILGYNGSSYNWSMNTSAIQFDNLSTYTVTAQAVDAAGNPETPHGAYDVKFYLQTPGAATIVTQPPNPGFFQYGPFASGPVTSIQGSGANMVNAGGIQLSLQRMTSPTSYWYDLSDSWTNVPATYTPVHVNGTGNSQSWNYPWTASPFTVDNASYTLTATPINSLAIAGTPVSFSFVYDKTPPQAALTAPTGTPCAGAGACFNLAAVSPSLNISGTAVDPNNAQPPSIANTGVLYRLRSPSQWWNGVAFQGSAVDNVTNPLAFSAAGTPPTYSWSTGAAVTSSLQDGILYTVLAHAVDEAGNDSATNPPSEGSMANFTFVYDTQPPTGYMIQPDSGNVYSALATISGTALDPSGIYGGHNSGVASVKIQIEDDTKQFCWDESLHAFDLGCPHFFGVAGTNPWIYNDATLNAQITNAHSYTITAQAADNAGNVQGSPYSVPSSSRSFTVDKNPPTAGFLVPANNQAYQSSALDGGSALNGTASDAESSQYSGAAIASGSISLWYLSGGTSYYWTGTQFYSPVVSSAQWVSVNNTTSWSMVFTGTNWVDNQQYYAMVRMNDNALDVSGAPNGNQTSVFNPGQNEVAFIVNNNAPVSAVINPPASGFIQNLAGISGISNVHLPGAALSFRVWYVVGASSYYWTGSGWNAAAGVATQLPVQVIGSTGTVAWLYPGNVVGQNTPTITGGMTDDTSFGLAIQGLDPAGNLETPTTVQVILDRVGPLMSLTAPSTTTLYYDAATLPATISGTATDFPAGVAVVGLQINDQTDGLRWNGTSFVSPAVSTGYLIAIATNPWSYPAPAWIPNKQYQLVARSTDNAGNLSQTYSTATFIYDVRAPTATIAIPNQSNYAFGQPTTLSGTAFDWDNGGEVMSGLASVSVAVECSIGASCAGTYWTGGSFSGGLQYRSASTTTATTATWTYPGTTADSLPSFQNGYTYVVSAHATDLAGNSGPDKSYTFMYDAEAPTTTIKTPLNATYATSFALSSGTYVENESGIQFIYVAVADNLSSFWNGVGPGFATFDQTLSWHLAQVFQSSWVYVDADLSANIAENTQPAAYTFYARAVDNAGNDSRGGPSQPSTFGNTQTYDFFPPSSGFSSPVSGSSISANGSVTPISGTAKDQPLPTPGIGVQEVRIKAIQIDSGGGLKYWHGASWLAGDPGFNMTTTPNPGWGAGETSILFSNVSAAISEASFLDGYRYQIVAQAHDVLNNYDPTYSTTTFLLDLSTPTVALLRPAGSSAYVSTNTLTYSTGTFLDPLVGGNIPSGVTAVYVQIQDISGSIPGGQSYWTGSGSNWQAGSAGAYGTATLYQSSWSISGLPDFTRSQASPDGRQYEISVFAVDAAGNTGAFPNYDTAVATITFDGTKPLSYVVAPAPGGNATTLATITGTAVDPEINSSSSDVRGVAVSILDNTGGDATAGEYWSVALGMWVPTLTWNPAAYVRATGVWTLSAPGIDSTLVNLSNYVIVSSATDYAGNVEAGQVLNSHGYAAVTFEPPPAVVTISAPASLIYYNQLTQLKGGYNPATVSIDLQLSRATDGLCWSGTAALGWVNCLTQVSTATRVISASGPSWTYPNPGDVLPDWGSVNNTTMTLKVTGINEVPILGTPAITQFYVDRSSPTSSVTFPGDGAFLGAPPALTGPSVDDLWGQSGQVSAGVQSVSMYLIRTDLNDYWDVVSGSWTNIVTASTVAYNTSTQQWSFTSSTPTLTWMNGLQYSLVVWGQDNAQGAAAGGNTEVAGALIHFRYDTTQPTIAFTAPTVQANDRETLSTIWAASGTASATSPDSLALVEVRYFDQGNNRFMNPAPGQALAFNLSLAQSELAWTTATFVTDWTHWYLSSGPIFAGLDGTTFTAIARSLNQAGTFSTQYATTTFVYDSLAPQTGVSTPTNTGYISSLAEIAGTVFDYPLNNPAAIFAVNVEILRLADGEYWTGSLPWKASATPLTLPADNIYVSSWTIVGSLPSLTPGDSYYVTTSGVDSADGGGNVEPFNSPRGSTFTYDNQAPTSGIAWPVNASYRNTLTTISGTATDIVGVSTVALSVQDTSISAPNCYVPGSGFTGTCPSWFLASGSPANWTYAFSNSAWTQANTYVFLSSAANLAEVQQTATSQSSFTYTVGIPTVTLTTALYINSGVTALTGTAVD
ncbi:MAG: hypothetical protein ACHQ49_07440, partial [Elusimicrobiota bacterium]